MVKTRFAMGMSEQDARKNRNFNTLGGSAVAEFVADVFVCPFEACRIRSVSDPSYVNGMLVTGQKLVAENGVVNDLYSGFGPMLFKQISKIVAKFCWRGGPDRDHTSHDRWYPIEGEQERCCG